MVDRSNKWIKVINKKSKKDITTQAYDNGATLEPKNYYGPNNLYDSIMSHYYGGREDSKNMKKILCNNILISKSCHYGDKCKYAHRLEDQNVEPIRKKAYDIIKGLEKINYKPERELSKTFLQLTKVCDLCCLNKCPGGYNCKYGVFDKIYQVCADDLKYGICYNTSCNNVHLTNKGLIPLNANRNIIKTLKYTERTKNISIPDGTLLSDDFFLNLKKNIKGNNNDPNRYDLGINDSDDSDESRKRIKEYLDFNSDSDKSCNESIFKPLVPKKNNFLKFPQSL